MQLEPVAALEGSCETLTQWGGETVKIVRLEKAKDVPLVSMSYPFLLRWRRDTAGIIGSDRRVGRPDYDGGDFRQRSHTHTHINERHFDIFEFLIRR